MEKLFLLPSRQNFSQRGSPEEQKCRMKIAFLHISAQSYIYIFCFTTTLHTPPRNPTQWRVLCRILRPNPTHLPIWLSNFKPELYRICRKCIYPWKTYRFERWIRAPRARSLFHFFPAFLFCVQSGTSFAVSPNTMRAVCQNLCSDTPPFRDIHKISEMNG